MVLKTTAGQVRVFNVHIQNYNAYIFIFLLQAIIEDEVTTRFSAEGKFKL